MGDHGQTEPQSGTKVYNSVGWDLLLQLGCGRAICPIVFFLEEEGQIKRDKARGGRFGKRRRKAGGDSTAAVQASEPPPTS